MLDHVYAGPTKTLTSVPIDCPFCDVSCFFYHVLIGINVKNNANLYTTMVWMTNVKFLFCNLVQYWRYSEFFVKNEIYAI